MPKILLTLLGFISILGTTSFAQISFTESANNLGINTNYGLGNFGGGVSFCDFNNDGWDDITFASTNGNPIRFFQNNEGQFSEVYLGINENSETKQINWVDIDNDGDQDLFVTSNYGTTRLFENFGNTSFADITSTSGISISGGETWGASWADLDNNGYVDVFICYRDINGNLKNDLYFNNGNNTFTYSDATATQEDINDISFCSALFDYNNDGWVDIYIANDRTIYNNVLYRNNGNGTFTDVSAGSGADVSIDAMSTTIGDYNNDGWLDIYVTNTFAGNAFLQNNGDGTFTDLASTNGTLFESIGWGAVFLDADNDSHLDLYVSGMVSSLLVDTLASAFYHNDGSGNYTIPTGVGFETDTAESFSNAIGDIDNDGYPDIVVSNHSPDNHHVWKNNGGNNHWLKANLQGTVSNRNGIGSWIKVYAGGTTLFRYTLCGEGYLAQNSSSEFFGLENHTMIDSIVINWPSGLTDVYQNVTVDQDLLFIEGQSAEINVHVTTNGSTDFCTGDSVILTASASNCIWSNGSTNQSITVSSSGNYWVTAYNSSGMSGQSAPISVTVHDPGLILFTQDISCFGANDGSIDCQTNESGCTFLWSESSTTEDIQGLSPGTYSILMTDPNGCIVSDSATISEPSEIQLTTGSTPQMGFLPNGSAWVVASGGTPPYDYFWNDSLAQNVDSATQLTQGYYTVWVIDGNGCSDSMSVYVDGVAGTVEMFMTDFEVYPNPSKGTFQLILSESAQQMIYSIDIFSIDGKHHGSLSTLTGNQTIEVDFPPGVYFLRMRSASSSGVKKIILR